MLFIILLVVCFLYFSILKQFLFPKTIILTKENIDQVVKLLIKYFGSNYYVKRHAFDQDPYKLKINWYVGYQKEEPDIIEKDNSVNDYRLFIRMCMGFGRGNLIELGAKILFYKNKIRIYEPWRSTDDCQYIIDELKKCELQEGDLKNFKARDQFQKDLWNDLEKELEEDLEKEFYDSGEEYFEAGSY